MPQAEFEIDLPLFVIITFCAYSPREPQHFTSRYGLLQTEICIDGKRADGFNASGTIGACYSNIAEMRWKSQRLLMCRVSSFGKQHLDSSPCSV